MESPVPPLDLKRQYEALYPELREAFERVLLSGQFILGPDVTAFEKELADYLKVKHVIGVTSGTDALFMSLRALGVNRDDQVLTSSFTFFGTVSAILNAGAEPVFADVDPGTFNLDAEKVEEILKKDTARKIKVILPVHLYGQGADMAALTALSQKYGVPIVEDACQAIGAEFQGKKLGAWGAFGAFSLFPTKNLGALGDAGFLSTQDDALAEKARSIRNHGCAVRYYHDRVGGNFRIDTMQAAFLRVFLPKLDGWLQERQALAAAYDEGLASSSPILEIPKRQAGSTHVFHQYTVKVRSGLRDLLSRSLQEQKIACAVYYPVPCHLQKALSDSGFQRGILPVTESVCTEVLSLPIFPGMQKTEQVRVIETINRFCRENN